jgi:chromatin assembly factor 1 subunit A
MTPDNVSVGGVSSRRSSIASIDMDRPNSEQSVARSNSEFDKWILPFFKGENTELAPVNRFLTSHSTEDAELRWLETQDYTSSTSLFRPRRARVRRVQPVKEVLATIGDSLAAPIDLTSTGGKIEELRNVPYKFLRFKEDVRPPYQGTYTRAVSPRTARKLSRQPTYRGLPDTDYDYDSEAEWQEPEEDDEDLEAEDDLSEDDGEGDEMDDFLDDEADAGKRQIATSDVEPVSTGLCWEGETEHVVAGIDISLYRMQVMHDAQGGQPIDPYTTDHWHDPPSRRADHKFLDGVTDNAASTMQPPRLPLSSVSVNSSPFRNFIVGGNKAETKQSAAVSLSTKENALGDQPQSQKPSQKGRLRDSNKPNKRVPDDLLPAFKAAVEGSDLNKIGLVEILKKQFPKCSKDAIKGSLEAVAERRGVKEVDKRWVLL